MNYFLDGVYAEEKIFEHIDSMTESVKKYVPEEKALATIIRMMKENTQLTGKVYKYAHFTACDKDTAIHEKIDPHTNMYYFLKANKPNNVDDFVINPVFATMATHDGRGVKYKNMAYTKVYDICVLEYKCREDVKCKYINSMSNKQYQEILNDAKDHKLIILYNIEGYSSSFRTFYVDMTDSIDYNMYIVDEIKHAMETMPYVREFRDTDTVDTIINDILRICDDNFRRGFERECDITVDIKPYGSEIGGCLENITFKIGEKTDVADNVRIVGFRGVMKSGNVFGKEILYPLEYGSDGLVNWDSYDKYNACLANAFKMKDVSAVVVYSKYYARDGGLEKFTKRLNVIINYNVQNIDPCTTADKVEVEPAHDLVAGINTGNYELFAKGNGEF